MSMLERRLQILLDEERYTRLQSAARERGVSVATIVREAIDRGLAGPQEPRRAAGARILEAADMSVGDPDVLLAELDALRARRA